MRWLTTIYRFYTSNGPALAIFAIVGFAFLLLGNMSAVEVYRHSFDDLPSLFQTWLAIFTAGTTTTTVIWLLYRAIVTASVAERLVATIACYCLWLAVSFNVGLHYALWRGAELWPLHLFWLHWSGVVVLLANLVVILVMILFDPVVRLIRLQLREMKVERNALSAQRLPRPATCEFVAAALLSDNRGQILPHADLDIFPTALPPASAGVKLLRAAGPVLDEPPSYGDGYTWRRHEERGGWHLWQLCGNPRREARGFILPGGGVQYDSRITFEHYVGFLSDEAWNSYLKYYSAEEFKSLLRNRLLTRPGSQFETPRPVNKNGRGIIV